MLKMLKFNDANVTDNDKDVVERQVHKIPGLFDDLWSHVHWSAAEVVQQELADIIGQSKLTQFQTLSAVVWTLIYLQRTSHSIHACWLDIITTVQTLYRFNYFNKLCFVHKRRRVVLRQFLANCILLLF